MPPYVHSLRMIRAFTDTLQDTDSMRTARSSPDSLRTAKSSPKLAVDSSNVSEADSAEPEPEGTLFAAREGSLDSIKAPV